MQRVFPRSVFRRNAAIYQVMANPTRLHILNYIKNREASVTELVRVLGLRKANVSQHLAVLRHQGLVKARKQGLSVFYRIADPRIVEPCRIFRDLTKQRAFV
jgi:ArsR family transcriptional regulator